jgi:hypothetical protein
MIYYLWQGAGQTSDGGVDSSNLAAHMCGARI